MEKERFDTLLSSAVLEHEEKSTVSFNRNRVWRKSTGNRRRKNLVAVIYIAATVIFALNILFTWNQDKATREGIKNEKRAEAKTQVPFTSSPERKAFSGSRISSRSTEVQQITTARDLSYAIPESKGQESQFVANQQIKESDPLPVSNQHPLTLASSPVQDPSVIQVDEDIKAIFKPGRPAQTQPQPDVIATLKKGSRFRFDLKRASHDSSYYATESTLKFKLKSSNQ